MNLREILTELGIDFKEVGTDRHVTSGWAGCRCPWCGSDEYHLGINLSSGGVSCWRCGQHRLGETLKEISGQPWNRIKELLEGIERVHIRKEPSSGRLVYPKGIEEMGPAHKRYLRRRGFDPHEIHQLWGVHGIGLSCRLAWRLFLPIADVTGKVVSWTTRSIRDDVDSRYTSAGADEEAVPAKSLLYGEHYARHAIIVVEGPTDVWRIGPGCVGTLGLSYSQNQVVKMSRYPIRVVCFDNEHEAQKRAKALCAALAPYPGKTIRAELDAKDPGSASNKEIAKLRKEFLE